MQKKLFFAVILTSSCVSGSSQRDFVQGPTCPTVDGPAQLEILQNGSSQGRECDVSGPAEPFPPAEVVAAIRSNIHPSDFSVLAYLEIQKGAPNPIKTLKNPLRLSNIAVFVVKVGARNSAVTVYHEHGFAMFCLERAKNISVEDSSKVNLFIVGAGQSQ